MVERTNANFPRRIFVTSVSLIAFACSELRYEIICVPGHIKIVSDKVSALRFTMSFRLDPVMSLTGSVL